MKQNTDQDSQRQAVVITSEVNKENINSDILRIFGLNNTNS